MDPEDQPDKRAADAFFAHDVNELTMKDVKVKWNTLKVEPMWRHAFSFENVNGLYLDELKGDPAPTKNGAMINLNNVESAIIEACRPDDINSRFLQINGERSKNIFVVNSLLANMDSKIIKGKEVNPACVQLK